MTERMVFGMPYVEFTRNTEEAFFAAMSQGYAAESVKPSQLLFEDWKRTLYRHEMESSSKCFYITDRWCDEGGQTLIEYETVEDSSTSASHRLERIPVWVMRYAGHYHDSAIPFLKVALWNRYQVRDFCGGRGPKEYAPEYERRAQEIIQEINASGGRKDSSPSWDGNVYGSFDFYKNDWTGNFVKFEGFEEIYMQRFPHAPSQRTVSYGSHRYWGGMLV